MKYFWYTLCIVALVVNENIVQWALAVIVANFSFINGFKDAFEYFSVGGYAFFTLFRLIPYAMLTGAVLIGMKRQSPAVNGFAWGGLIGIVTMIVWGSWDAQRDYYTGEHVSSTTNIAFLVIPILALFTGCIGALSGYVIQRVIKKLKA